MGGRGASSGKGGGGRASNTKYNGFKVVSKDGEEMNLVIENGVVKWEAKMPFYQIDER